MLATLKTKKESAMNDQIIQDLEGMSEQELEQLLATDFGAELEKEAAAELANADLAEALFAYGAHVATREVESTEDLSKEAAAELDEEYQVITEAIENGLVETGVLQTEDTAQLHKEAQAAAGIIFAGYTEAMSKIASDEKKAGKMAELLAKAKANKGKIGAGVAGAAALGAGAYAYKKKHEKKASEVTASEMADIIREDQAVDAVISNGLSKLAGMAEMKAKAAEVGGKVIEGVKKHKAPLAAGAGGFALGKMLSKKKKEKK
jgi:hypothetical protein